MPETPSIEYLRLVTQHQTALFCFIRSIAPTLKDAEDVVQEANILLWKKSGDFKPGTNFKAFAFRIAYLKVMEALRKSSRIPTALFDEKSVSLILNHWQETPDAAAQSLDALDKCLAKLPESDRELLLLRYHAGKTVRSLAKKKNIGESALQQRFFRIRNALRDCIKQYTKTKNET